MSKLMLSYYESKESFGIIGSRTVFKIKGETVCIGDTITYEYENNRGSGIVVQIGNKVMVYSYDILSLKSLKLLDIKTSHNNYKEGDTFSNLRICVLKVDDLL